MNEPGEYKISEIVFNDFRLDGGAMFGVVPRTIWEPLIKPDELNRIPLVCRSLLLEGNGRKILIDTGMHRFGDKKFRSRFAISDREVDTSLDFNLSVTDLLITHLHFDHAAALAAYDDNGDPIGLRYPNATIHLQSDNLSEAINPSIRERASYLQSYIKLLKTANLNLINGNIEVLPGILTHRIDGHTIGQQWFEIATKRSPIFYLADLVPTHNHIPLPFILGYDLCARQSLKEKKQTLDSACEKDAILVYEHDSEVAASTIASMGEGYQHKTLYHDLSTLL